MGHARILLMEDPVMSNIVIEAERLVKRFPTRLFPRPTYKTVLRGVSFQIKEKEKLALIGPNGSGKTSLLKILATIYLPDEGKLRFFGKDGRKEFAEIAKLCSIVSPALDFHKKLTLRQTLKFFARVQGSSIDLAIDFLNLMGLDHMLDTRLESFSEGQKAVTRIGVGLMKDPEILFLDEVASGLDVNRREELIDYINENLSEKTIVIVDHDPILVSRICDRYFFLNRGRIVAKGTTELLVKQLPYRYVITAVMSSRQTEAGMKSLFPENEVSVDGYLVNFQVSDSIELMEILERLNLAKKFITRYSVHLTDLSNVYKFISPSKPDTKSTKLVIG